MSKREYLIVTEPERLKEFGFKKCEYPLRDEYAKDKDIWTLFKIQFLKLDIRAKYRIQL
jgi:hypothetical protein